MKKRNDYINDSLIHARDRLRNYQENQNSSPENSADEPVSGGEEVAAVVPEAAPKAAINRKQLDEYLRNRRDLLVRLAEFSALLDAELERGRKIDGEASKYLTLFEQFFKEINELPEDAEAFQNEPSRIVDCGKQLEQARLVMIRHTASVRKLLASCNPAVAGGATPDFLSLTPFQLFRMGFWFLLPLLGGILIGAVAIGLAIIMTMGGI